MNDKYYTISEIAQMLKVHDRTVLRLIKAKKLKAVNVGAGKNAHWRIFEGQYLKFVAEFYK
jgi:excisionase family DNA binding protein